MKQHSLRKILLILFVAFGSTFSFHNLQGQSRTSVTSIKYTISGYVRDSSSGEELIGASVGIPDLRKGAVTNLYGFYSITVPKGRYSVVYSYMGYRTSEIIVVLNKNLRKNVELSPKAILTKEVRITAERKDQNIQSTDVGKIELNVEETKAIPVILGEADILKTIQLLPGVQSAGEGNSGFYVRGGGPDQNLILLDEAVVYNTGHLFGFFSVFNSDAIKNTTLIKGGMPANYGGRLSAVVDISMKEGNNKKYEAEGGIGMIASRLTIEGPIIKEKSSFMISGRRTYADLLMRPFTKHSDLEGSGYYFYDLNTKFNYRFSDKDRLYLSGYFGRDVFSFKSMAEDMNIKMPWGNSTATLRWNHLFNEKLFLNTSAIYNDYKFEIEMGSEDMVFKLFSGVEDINIKLDFNYFPGASHKIKFGSDYIYHTLIPSSASANSYDGVDFDTENLKKKYAHETALYLMDNFDITEKIRVNAGLRFTNFTIAPPYTHLITDEDNYVLDTVYYHSGDDVESFFGLEPRLNIRYKLGKTSSLKGSYTYNKQYIHLVTNSTSTLPTDIWIPSTKIVKPQLVHQYSIGYFRNFLDNKLEGSVELYYKQLKNQIEYVDGFTPILDRELEWDFVFGEGESFGAEFFLNKRYGKFTGWIGYTISKTSRHFPDLNTIDFLAKYDRPHDLSVVGIYKLSKKFTFSGTFIYGSGMNTTIPVNLYIIENWPTKEYGPRNGYRLEPYHRADVAISYNTKSKRGFVSQLAISIYNVYNHKNLFFIYYDEDGNSYSGTRTVVAKKVTLFPIIPSITWNFKF